MLFKDNIESVEKIDPQALVDAINRLDAGTGKIGKRTATVETHDVETIGRFGGEKCDKTIHGYTVSITTEKQRGSTSISLQPFSINPSSHTRYNGSLVIEINGEHVGEASGFGSGGWTEFDGDLTKEEYEDIVDFLTKVKTKVKQQKEQQVPSESKEPSPRKRFVATLSGNGGGH